MLQMEKKDVWKTVLQQDDGIIMACFTWKSIIAITRKCNVLQRLSGDDESRKIRLKEYPNWGMPSVILSRNDKLTVEHILMVSWHF